MPRSHKPINTDFRPVPGGFVRRENLGDCLKWRAYGPDKEPIKDEVTFNFCSEAAAREAVLNAMDLTLAAFVERHNITMEPVPANTNPMMAQFNDPEDEIQRRWMAEAQHFECHFRLEDATADAADFSCHFSVGRSYDDEDMTAVTVLESIGLDALAIENSRNFEEWANDFGYSTDSRRAEAAYRASRDQIKRLKRWMGPQRWKEFMTSMEAD